MVKAVDGGANESGYSNEASATPTDLPPAAPTNLAATASEQGEGQVSLNWDDNSESDLDGYNVYRSIDSGGSPTPYTKINGSLVLTSDYNDSGLTDDVTYYYVVKAVDGGANESGYSNEGSATPTDLPPAAPTNLAAIASEQGEGQVSLNWDDNTESDLAGYDVYRSTDSGGSPTPYTKINGSLVLTSDYNDSGLTGGVTYYYVVTAVDSGANASDYSNEASATPVGPPLLDDGFEDLQWDINWDDNGATDWTQNSSTIHGGLYSAGHASGNTYLTSDNLDASDATSITVSFWFYIKDLNKGPLYVQIYNGSDYINLYDDLTTYPGVTKTTWYQFSETITDSQYFISGFRIRFDGSTLTTDAFIDDVLIQKN